MIFERPPFRNHIVLVKLYNIYSCMYYIYIFLSNIAVNSANAEVLAVVCSALHQQQLRTRSFPYRGNDPLSSQSEISGFLLFVRSISAYSIYMYELY